MYEKLNAEIDNLIRNIKAMSRRGKLQILFPYFLSKFTGQSGDRSMKESKKLRDLAESATESIADLAHVDTSRATGVETVRAFEYFDKCIKTILELADRIEVEEISSPIGTISRSVDTIKQFAEPIYRLQTVIMADGIDQLPYGTKLYTHPQKEYVNASDPCMKIGKWLSAALDDPQVCQEMKYDIRNWFDAGKPQIQFPPEANFDANTIRQYRIVPKGSTWTDVKDDEVWDAMTKHPESYETRVLYSI